jgi:hypothetical protein
MVMVADRRLLSVMGVSIALCCCRKQDDLLVAFSPIPDLAEPDGWADNNERPNQ